MNWEMLAAVGQLAAVFVGIPSLIYLAVQIREQTKERRQSAVHALTVQWGDLTGSLHDNPEIRSDPSSRHALFHRSRRGIQAQVQRVLQSSHQYFRGNVFLSSPAHPDRIVVARGRADDERFAHPAFNNGGKLENIGTPKSLTISSASSSQKAISPRLSQPTIWATYSDRKQAHE